MPLRIVFVDADDTARAPILCSLMTSGLRRHAKHVTLSTAGLLATSGDFRWSGTYDALERANLPPPPSEITTGIHDAPPAHFYVCLEPQHGEWLRRNLMVCSRQIQLVPPECSDVYPRLTSPPAVFDECIRQLRVAVRELTKSIHAAWIRRRELPTAISIAPEAMDRQRLRQLARLDPRRDANSPHSACSREYDSDNDYDPESCVMQDDLWDFPEWFQRPTLQEVITYFAETVYRWGTPLKVWWYPPEVGECEIGVLLRYGNVLLLRRTGSPGCPLQIVRTARPRSLSCSI